MDLHQQPRTYGVLVGDVRDGQIDPTGATLFVRFRGQVVEDAKDA